MGLRAPPRRRPPASPRESASTRARPFASAADDPTRAPGSKREPGSACTRAAALHDLIGRARTRFARFGLLVAVEGPQSGFGYAEIRLRVVRAKRRASVTADALPWPSAVPRAGSRAPKRVP